MKSQPLPKRIFLITAGAILMAFNLVSFVRTAGLFPGGFTGLSLLIQEICAHYVGIHVPYSVLSLTLNIIAAAICFRYIGRHFALFSMLSVAITSVLTDLIPTFAVASDPLLNSVFGGIVNGAAISLCLRADASTGGTDFISIYLAEKNGKDAFNIILGGNVVMLYVYDRFFMPGKNKTGYEGNLPAIRIVQKETGPDSVLDIGFQWEKRKLLCHLPVYALMLVPIVLLLSVLAFTDLTSDLFAALTVICSCTAVSFCGLYLLVKVHVQYRKMMRVLVELLEKNFLAETVND